VCFVATLDDSVDMIDRRRDSGSGLLEVGASQVGRKFRVDFTMECVENLNLPSCVFAGSRGLKPFHTEVVFPSKRFEIDCFDTCNRICRGIWSSGCRKWSFHPRIEATIHGANHEDAVGRSNEQAGRNPSEVSVQI